MLPDPDAAILGRDMELLSAVKQVIASTERMIKDISKRDPAVKWHRSVPGIGEFFSVLVRYEVGDVSRFASAKKFASYTGLIPSTFSSGERTYHGRITKQGNKYLRWAFVDAVTPTIVSTPTLRAYYEGIKRRKGTKDARIATARKIAELCWRVWMEQRFYEVR